MEIFVPGNVPSLKNSKIKTANGVFPSKTVKKYLQSLGIQRYSIRNGVQGYKKRPNIFCQCVAEVRDEFARAEKPTKLGFYFVRRDRRKFDFINACQIICDLLTAHRVIEDDDCDHLLPVPWIRDGSCYCVDKANPGVWLKIMED